MEGWGKKKHENLHRAMLATLAPASGQHGQITAAHGREDHFQTFTPTLCTAMYQSAVSAYRTNEYFQSASITVDLHDV